MTHTPGEIDSLITGTENIPVGSVEWCAKVMSVLECLQYQPKPMTVEEMARVMYARTKHDAATYIHARIYGGEK